MVVDDIIRQHVLEQTTERRSLTPVAARRRGSRAMGVAHEGSDYDVHVLFASPAWKYACGAQQTFDYVDEENNIDITAWNVDKFAKHARDTNPMVVEFLQSDKDYIPDKSKMLGMMEDNIRVCGNRMAVYYHYRSLAENNYKKYIKSGNDETVGRAFYVLRALLAARYVRETNNLPPLHIDELLDECEGRVGVPSLRELTALKRGGQGDLPLGGIRSVIDDIFDGEMEREPEPTDERTKNPREDVIEMFLKRSIQGAPR